jgi:hypothetical protein
MKIVKHGPNHHWIVSDAYVALVSYETIIALQSINTSELVITRDHLSMTSRKHLNLLIATCPNYMHTELAQRDLSYAAIEALNASDSDPFTTDDDMHYTLSSVLPFSYAQELLNRYHGIDMLTGRYKTDQFYAVHDDTYAILYTGSIFLYFEAHK